MKGTRKKVGRLPAGKGGQLVKSYPQISVRVPLAVHALFIAAAEPFGNQSRAFELMLDQYIDSLAFDEKKKILKVQVAIMDKLVSAKR